MMSTKATKTTKKRRPLSRTAVVVVPIVVAMMMTISLALSLSSSKSTNRSIFNIDETKRFLEPIFDAENITNTSNTTNTDISNGINNSIGFNNATGANLATALNNATDPHHSRAFMAIVNVNDPCSSLTPKWNRYTHIILSSAITTLTVDGRCSETCDLQNSAAGGVGGLGEITVCDGQPNEPLLQKWRDDGIKVWLSFGGNEMGTSRWSNSNGKACWEYCFGQESKIVDQLINVVILNQFFVDGVVIDYQYRTQNYPNAINFLKNVTIGLKKKLLSNLPNYYYNLAHMPLDADVVSGSEYFDMLKELFMMEENAEDDGSGPRFDYLLPQYYSGVLQRPVTNDLKADSFLLRHFDALVEFMFNGDESRIISGLCNDDDLCGDGSTSNVNNAVDGVRAAAIMKSLTENHPCHGGAFFYSVANDPHGTWSIPMLQQLNYSSWSSNLKCSNGDKDGKNNMTGEDNDSDSDGDGDGDGDGSDNQGKDKESEGDSSDTDSQGKGDDDDVRCKDLRATYCGECVVNNCVWCENVSRDGIDLVGDSLTCRSPANTESYSSGSLSIVDIATSLRCSATCNNDRHNKNSQQEERVTRIISDNVPNALTQHMVTAQSLTQELYGIVDLPEGGTRVTFERIYNANVASYFSSNVDPGLFLVSKVTITSILLPSIEIRSLRRQRRNLQVVRGMEEEHTGSSVIVTYDQEISYYYPITNKMLSLETLVALPFLTESGRNQFNLMLEGSDDVILQSVVGVSEVNLPPQPPIIQPIAPPMQPSPTPPLSTKAPTNIPSTFPWTPSPTPLRPTYIDEINHAPIQKKSPVPLPISPPSVAPINPMTMRPTPIPTKAHLADIDENGDSGGISGFIVIGSLMALLFIIFTINMKFCMGEYVD